MRKLLSILLILGMLLSLAPMALASGEADVDEPEVIAGEPVIEGEAEEEIIEEPVIDEPALDGGLRFEINGVNMPFIGGVVSTLDDVSVPAGAAYEIISFFYTYSDESTGWAIHDWTGAKFKGGIPYGVHITVEYPCSYKQWERHEFQESVLPGSILYINGTPYDVRRIESHQYNNITEKARVDIMADLGYAEDPTLTRIDFTSLLTELTPGENIPNKYGVLKEGSHCTNPIYYWEDAAGHTAYGVPEVGKYYWLNVYIEPDAGYTFGPAGTTVPVYVNGTKIGDGTVETDVYGRAEMVHFTLRRTGTAGVITAADIDLTAPKAGAAIPYPANGVQAKGSHFTIGEQFWSTGYSTSGRITSGSFENGKTYYYYAELIPDDGWEFAGTDGRVTADELKVTACGEDAYSLAKSGSTGHVTVYIPVKATGPTYNGDIVLGGFTEPKAGAAVQSKAAAASTTFTVSSHKFSESPLGFGQTKDTTFQSGKTYYWICYVKLSDGYGFPEDYKGTLYLNGKEITPQTSAEYADALLNGKPIRYWSVSGDTMSITISYVPGSSAPAEKPTLTISSDAKSAKAENFTGLYARVAIILDNGGVSGLYVTQATINVDGTILIPEFNVPGLKVKGFNVSLVPTLADIQSSTPNVKATASKML